MRKKTVACASLLALALMVAFIVPAQAVADEDDPPTRVARLALSQGSVSFQPAGTDDWVSAVVNRPITTGDKLWTDNNSRAELHIGSASIRISDNTGFSFLNLTDNTTQIRLTSGTLRVRVKRLDDDENFEIDTPNLAFSILRPGIYRVHVNDDGDSTVIRVRSGEGEVTGGDSAYTVRARDVATFNGTDRLVADFESYGGDEDDFDAWCADRDRHEDLSASRRYVSDDVIGYEDLDDYGGWRPVPEYGNVWFPHTTVVGWAPYRYGHWAYIYPWGYTWVDDAPWGFAPFHYGRWVNYNGVWGWVPCPPRAPNVVYVRPVYAPALVAWVGGPHFGVGLSVGWFPLAPREVYVPSYPVSRRYINNVNVSNTTVNTTVINNYYNTTVINRNTTVINNNVTAIHQTYVNQSVPGAVTATTHQAFTSAQPVAKNTTAINARELASAPVNSFTPPVPPAKQAVLGSGARSTVPPVALQNRAVVAKVAPPPPPVAFVKQQQAIQANGGRPLGISQGRQIQNETPAVQHLVKVAPTPTNVQGNRPGPGQSAGSNQAGGQPNAVKTGAPINAGSSNPGGQQQAGGHNPQNTPMNASQQGDNRPNNLPVNNSIGSAAGNHNQNGNQKSYSDRPPASRPATGAGSTAGNINPELDQKRVQLDQKHQQEMEQLRAKQDQERQKVEQQQLQERQRLAQKTADEQRQQQLNQKHQQQLESLERKHDQEDQKLQQKQKDERKKTGIGGQH